MESQRIVVFDGVTIACGDAAQLYQDWPTPDVILSDGAYGVSGFHGDAGCHAELEAWYLRHIQAWTRFARPGTTLWFWNTEIGWATMHPILDAHGWEYIGCNIWNKGIQHIAGNCNLSTLRRFPVVTEVCAQYARRAEFHHAGETLSLQAWLRREWERTGLPFRKANEACGTRNAASRKYFARDHAWYAPPPEAFARIVAYANAYGDPHGRPYFSFDGRNPAHASAYARLFPTFRGQYGVTNVWTHPPLHGQERVRVQGTTRYGHGNQKPMTLIERIIEASSHPGDVIWEPFGGLCPAGLVALKTGRIAFCAEIDAHIFAMAIARLENYVRASRTARCNGG